MKRVVNNLFNKVKNQSGLRQIVFNSGWLLFDDLVRIIPNFFVGIWLARYLGPDLYGQWNYAIALVGMFSILSTLGLDNVIVRDLVKKQDKKDEILGSTFAMKAVGSTLALILAILSSIFLSNTHFITLLVFIVGLGYLFQSFDAINSWFIFKVESKYMVIARACAFLITTGIKILLIILHGPLIYFVITSIAELLLSGIGYIVAYKIDGESIFRWKSKWKVIKSTVIDCAPIIIAGAFGAIYLKFDRVLVNKLIDSAALGNYAVGTTLTDSWGFIATAITTSVYPAIIYSKNVSEKFYLNRLQKLYNSMVLLSVAIALPISIFSKQIIHLLYGSQYDKAPIVLSIYVWNSVFIFLDGATSKWFYTENLQKYILYKTIIGAACSVALNLILIPHFGIAGAAVASLISSFMVLYALNYFFKEIRIAFHMQTKSLFILSHIYDFAKYIRLSKKELNG
jgi:O-antigen/teichoic acid export membrane protein